MKDAEFTELTTESKLSEWGRWAVTAGKWELGYADVTYRPTQCPVRITDDQGLLIDSGIAKLRQHDKRAARVIVLRFLAQYSMTELAAALSCRRDVAKAYLLGAQGFMDGYFYCKGSAA